MNQKQTLEVIIENCIQHFEQLYYSPSCINHYKWVWKRKLHPFMLENSFLYYDRSIGDAFIRSLIPGPIINHYDRTIIRSINVLSDFLENRTIRKRHCNIITYELNGPIGLLMNQFLSSLGVLRRSAETILHYQRNLSRFLAFLNSKYVFAIENVTEIHVLSFMATQTNNRISIVSNFRMFFRFLFEEHFLLYDLSTTLQQYKWGNPVKLPSVYSSEEVLQIELSIQRSNATGKRDYAIMILASRLGLRASDIARLTFDNIHWENSIITLTQLKTNNLIELPLLSEVGESIIDYLKYGRKKSDSNRIFLYTVAPFSPMTGDAVSAAISRVIIASGIDFTHRKHGSHAMRHSLASRFLENRESLPVISEALGHQNINSTMFYLRIDIEQLRKCTLEVPLIATTFYEQKGGVFYE